MSCIDGKSDLERSEICFESLSPVADPSFLKGNMRASTFKTESLYPKVSI